MIAVIPCDCRVGTVLSALISCVIAKVRVVISPVAVTVLSTVDTSVGVPIGVTFAHLVRVLGIASGLVIGTSALTADLVWLVDGFKPSALEVLARELQQALLIVSAVCANASLLLVAHVLSFVKIAVTGLSAFLPAFFLAKLIVRITL